MRVKVHCTIYMLMPKLLYVTFKTGCECASFICAGVSFGKTKLLGICNFLRINIFAFLSNTCVYDLENVKGYTNSVQFKCNFQVNSYNIIFYSNFQSLTI